MYAITTNNRSFYDFNESCGMELDCSNKFIQVADFIPWEDFGKEYSNLFPSATGRPSCTFRCAICTLILQAYTKLSDRNLVEAIKENPYYQYFIGMKAFSSKQPFGHTTIVNFRKRITPDMITSLIDTINNFICKSNDKNFGKQEGQLYIANFSDDGEIVYDFENENLGTAILDATCSPSNIKFPQDYVLLNDARKKLEKMIDNLYAQAGKKGIKPKTYRRRLDKDFVKLAKQRRKNKKQIRSLLRKLLNSVKRNMGHIEKYIKQGFCLQEKEIYTLETIKKLYEQQRYMFLNNTHSVQDRIVSIDQPYIRPIVRGKAKNPVEFGAKYDVSIDDSGLARLEKISFDPYNESTIFQNVIERYKTIHGQYPKRALVDQIYRNKENIKYCQDRNITISGPKLGKPYADKEKSKKQKIEEKQNNIDRIEVERFFSTTKRVYGANLIRTRLKDTTFTTIGFTILAANLFSVMPMENIFLYFFVDFDTDKTISAKFWLLDK